MRVLALVGLVVFWISACTAVPFQEVALVSVEQVDPEAVRERFAVALPERFRIINTVTFEFKRQAFFAYLESNTFLMAHALSLC